MDDDKFNDDDKFRAFVAGCCLVSFALVLLVRVGVDLYVRYFP